MIRLLLRPRMLRALVAARLLGARVRYAPWLDVRGRWTGVEILLGRRATAAVLLHELGHHVYGHDCCREHEEFAAHGIGLFLARLLWVPYDDEHRLISSYVDWSAGCPRQQGDGAGPTAWTVRVDDDDGNDLIRFVVTGSARDAT